MARGKFFRRPQALAGFFAAVFFFGVATAFFGAAAALTIRKGSRLLTPTIQFGGLPRPVQVLPDNGSLNFGGDFEPPLLALPGRPDFANSLSPMSCT